MDQQLTLKRLQDRQYMEVEGLLQSMDMPSSGDLFDGPLPSGAGRQRCYTMPHVPPPAPPSTPTLLTNNTTTTNNTTIGSTAAGHSTSVNLNGSSSNNGTCNSSPTCSTGSLVPVDNQINHFIYVKNGKRRPGRCVDSELSKLFNAVSITNRLSDLKNRASSRGILNASRTISKLHAGSTTGTKIFKIHRDPKDFLRETDEDSVSAPEYDEEQEDTRYRFLWRTRTCRRRSRMERKFARFEHHERMETIVDSFDAAMRFTDADT
ncbi:uncharacterized protein [Drosophila tropicalis]|uniref:uncharacterized protein n=1 Tax=Drosophila tropicalis TaxID=46794 RepID=UPI0035AB8822